LALAGKHEAVLFMYAALGLEYGDNVFDVATHARNVVCKSGWIEGYTRTVCEVAGKGAGKGKGKVGAAKGKGKAADDGYVTDDRKEELEKVWAEYQEQHGHDDEDGNSDGEGFHGKDLFGILMGAYGCRPPRW
jgi:hypothetical protein